MSFAISGGVQALNVVTGVLLARGLGVEGRGQLAAALLWPAMITALGCIGMPDSTTFHASRRRGELGTLAGTSLAIGIAQSVVLCAAGVAIVHVALARYGAHVVDVATIALAYIPLYLLTLYLLNILNGLGRATAFHALRLTVVAGVAAGLIVLSLGGRTTVLAATIVYLAAHLAVGLAALVIVLRERVRLSFDVRLARSILGFGIRSHLNSVATQLNDRLDQIVISILLAPASLGIYVIAVTLTSLTSMVGSSVTLVAGPVIAALPEGPERTAAARRYVQITAAASIAIVLPMIVFAPNLIRLFFGDEFTGGTTVCRILLVASVLLATGRSLGAILTAAGRPLAAGVPEALGLGVTVTALALLVPAFGLVGAGFASLIAYSVTLAWMLRTATRVFDGSSGLPLAPAWHKA